MDPTLARYAAADPLFYDMPRAGVDAPTFCAGLGLDWDGWQIDRREPWTYLHPGGLRLPDQGWKVHVSATATTATRVLELAAEFCMAHRLSFKHLTGPRQFAASNSKEADRGSAGKFITVYPEDETRLLDALTGLDALVGGQPGPYILSDLRWRSGPVFVRYGAFARMWTRDERGQLVPALRDPEGRLVEDRRTAGFTPPSWAPMPAFLRKELAALGDSTPPDSFGYKITRVLHYSNAGGVYEATDAGGTRVVLKEGRPHAGVTPDGRDGATRILDEERNLLALAETDVVGVRDAFTLHDHRFLVLEYVDGSGLNTEIVRRNPSIHGTSSATDYRDYARWACGISDQLTSTVRRLHAAGYVHGDLHPRNVVVRPDGRVTLLDLEMSRPIAEHTTTLIGAPGFVAPDKRGGASADRYALACIKIALFSPLTSLIPLDEAKAEDLLEHIRGAYGIDEEWLDCVRTELRLPALLPRPQSADDPDRALIAWDTTGYQEARTLEERIGASLESCADFTRVDRLWPGDPRQFSENGAGLAHGASGVIHALNAADLDVPTAALDWLDEATTRTDTTTGNVALGLFDGLAGVIWLHDLHGRHDRADAMIGKLLASDLSELGPDLYGGLPGVGLLLLSRSRSEPRLIEAAATIAGRLSDHHERHRPPLNPDKPAPVAKTDHVGLMWGATGTALFALRLYERTGDRQHLRMATRALDYDLAHCATADDGSLQVNEGWRLDPYLASGSVGIGLVAAQLLPHLPDPERYHLALDGIAAAACTPFTIEPGLFYGRAGMIHFLVGLARMGLQTPAMDRALARHVEQLRLHALRHGAGIGFPGRGLMRMSCDLATGSAGVLTALRAHALLAFEPHRAGWNDLLPLLLPAAPSGATDRATETSAGERR